MIIGNGKNGNFNSEKKSLLDFPIVLINIFLSFNLELQNISDLTQLGSAWFGFIQFGLSALNQLDSPLSRANKNGIVQLQSRKYL